MTERISQSPGPRSERLENIEPEEFPRGINPLSIQTIRNTVKSSRGIPTLKKMAATLRKDTEQDIRVLDLLESMRKATDSERFGLLLEIHGASARVYDEYLRVLDVVGRCRQTYREPGTPYTSADVARLLGKKPPEFYHFMTSSLGLLDAAACETTFGFSPATMPDGRPVPLGRVL